jgi:murein DD-endopeptidase MepM/ murein hydrolase activator NlpD
VPLFRSRSTVTPRPAVISIAFALVATLAVGAPTVGQDAVPGVAQPKPFIWPTTGRVTQPFGCTGFWAEPRYGSCRHFHGGIDIADKQGTPIHAAADGVVTHVGWDPWGTRNWMVMINHGGGLTTWYAHLRGRDIAGINVGARVRQGEVIGYMSDTGMATGVHLHWAVLKDGRYVNPRKYVEGKPFRPRQTGRPTTAASCDDIWIAAAPTAATAMVLPGGDGALGGDFSCSA